jgi:hypothetical protein
MYTQGFRTLYYPIIISHGKSKEVQISQKNRKS